jgi:hypothetical protein
LVLLYINPLKAVVTDAPPVAVVRPCPSDVLDITPPRVHPSPLLLASKEVVVVVIIARCLRVVAERQDDVDSVSSLMKITSNITRHVQFTDCNRAPETRARAR